MTHARVVIADELRTMGGTHRLTVAHCRADWNKIDLEMDALIEDIRSEFEPGIEFCALDFDDRRNWEFFERLVILTVPTLICVVNGEPKAMLIGMRPKCELQATLHAWTDQYLEPV